MITRKRSANLKRQMRKETGEHCWYRTLALHDSLCLNQSVLFSGDVENTMMAIKRKRAKARLCVIVLHRSLCLLDQVRVVVGLEVVTVYPLAELVVDGNGNARDAVVA